MPRKTLALISGLVLVTVILFVVALRAGQQANPPAQKSNPATSMKPEPTTPAHTLLTVGPNPLTLAPSQQGTAQVSIDTSDNDVTAVQLELGYDPTILSNVKVTYAPLFKNPAILIDKNDPVKGRYTYAFGITPSSQPVKGTGVVATVTFTVKPGTVGKQTQLGLLPNSLVTARGVANSVLKSGQGTIITVTAAGSGVGTQQGTVTLPKQTAAPVTR